MKRKLRREIREAVGALPEDYRLKADRGIREEILTSPLYRNAKTIFCYVGTEREIHTLPLLLAAIREGKTVAVPLCGEEPGVMVAKAITGEGDLISGKYGIPEPRETCPTVEPEDFDLALIPCASGNRRGQRLGYGGGYYDRYLGRVRCPTLLLCRDRLTRENIPVEEHDLLMDFLVTESGIFPCHP